MAVSCRLAFLSNGMFCLFLDVSLSFWCWSWLSSFGEEVPNPWCTECEVGLGVQLKRWNRKMQRAVVACFFARSLGWGWVADSSIRGCSFAFRTWWWSLERHIGGKEANLSSTVVCDCEQWERSVFFVLVVGIWWSPQLGVGFGVL